MSIPDIYDSFKGKSVFFTGVTGFVGKVYLYKILKEFPDIGTIYCLCRSKKGVSMEDRFAKGVLSSPCFLPLIKEIGEEEWKRRTGKCVAVAGDITHHRLGIDEKQYDEMCENVNQIVHMAATVDFDEKLNISCNMNVLGSIRVLALAHKCRRLESYIHCSTCYVNWNRHGDTPVKEQLYPLPFDPEQMLKYIMSLDNGQMPSETKKLLKQYNYPNTYTFTKSITEHILMKQRGNLPLVIVRPSIIGCAWREPYTGWVDALTAAGGLFLMSGLGLLHEFIGNERAAADVVPVDHVVNLILKVTHRTILYHHATAFGQIVADTKTKTQRSTLATIVSVDGKTAGNGTATDGLIQGAVTAGGPPLRRELSSMMATGSTTGGSDPDGLGAGGGNFCRVYQSSTSSTMNPMRWITSRHALLPYWNRIKHPKMIGPAFVTFYPNPKVWAANFYAKRVIPINLLLAVRKIPGLKDPKQTKMLEKLRKATNKVYDLNMQFAPFTNKTWFYETSNALEYLEEGLSKKSQLAFSTDVFDINWFHYVEAYCWGMIKFIMKDDSYEQPAMPKSGTEQVLRAQL